MSEGVTLLPGSVSGARTPGGDVQQARDPVNDSKTPAQDRRKPEPTEGKDLSGGTAGQTVGQSVGLTQVAVTPANVSWQWEHRKGWRDYDRRAVNRIEQAFQNGHSMVRVKTGKKGSTPMEIFFADMIQYDPVSGNTRPVKRVGPDSVTQRARRNIFAVVRSIETGEPRHMVFAQYENQRKTLMEEIDQRDYNVKDLYHETGCIATCARSNCFHGIAMLVVFVNCLWLGFDANFNEAATIWDAKLGYQIVENIFCVFFLGELLIRFFAWKVKRDAFKDFWFVFDFALLMLMIGETWLLPLCILIAAGSSGPGRGGWSMLRLARLAKLLRLGRLARLLRTFPEVVTLVKGILIAVRSVFFTFVVLGVLLYCFGIIFKIQSIDDRELTDHFGTVHGAMWLLFLEGIILDGPKDTLNTVKDHSYALSALFVVFIFLAAFTIMNMLIGIICNVVDQVSQTEKDEAAVSYLRSTLLDLLECHDEDDNRKIHKNEFELLMRNPEMHFILTRFGVDTSDLISLKDTLFEDRDANMLKDTGDAKSYERQLTFGDFLRVVMRLRGNNSAKVTDVVELRDYVALQLKSNKEQVLQNMDLLLQRHLYGEVRRPLEENNQAELQPVITQSVSAVAWGEGSPGETAVAAANVLREAAGSVAPSWQSSQPPLAQQAPIGPQPQVLRDSSSFYQESSPSGPLALARAPVVERRAATPSGASAARENELVTVRTVSAQLVQIAARQQEQAARQEAHESRQRAWQEDMTRRHTELADQVADVHRLLSEFNSRLENLDPTLSASGNLELSTSMC